MLKVTVCFKVIEVALNEEYNLINVESAQGGFVDEVRSECNNVLIDIAEKCFDIEILKAEQTKRIISSIEASYEVKPEYLWEKYPSYYVRDNFIRLIPFKDHINVEAQAIIQHKEELVQYKITPKGMLQIKLNQAIPLEVLNKIFIQTFKS